MTTQSTRQDKDKVIAMLAPSPFRRYFGIGGLAALGTIFAYVVMVTGLSSTLATITIVLAAVLSFVLAYRMFVATSDILQLKREGLFTTKNELVAQMDNIEKIELGIFVMKPSNGFLIVLKEPMDRRWQPGLWWRFGHRVGIGGVTSRPEGKAMADAMQILLQNIRNQETNSK